MGLAAKGWGLLLSLWRSDVESAGTDSTLKMKKWGRNEGVARFYVVYTTGEMWRNCDHNKTF
jgi:hypothetical protein